MPRTTVHPPESAGPHRRVRVTNEDTGDPIVTFYGATDSEARSRATNHGYAVPDQMVYTVQRVASRWQSSVRRQSNPIHRPEAVFYAETEQTAHTRAQDWIRQQEDAT